MSIFKKISKKKKRKTTRNILAVLGVVGVACLAVVLVSQSNRQAQINLQMQQLEEEHKLLSDEKQRLENMVEYVHSEEYLLQYAREKLGFVKPDDIKFDTGEEQ